MLTFVSAVKSDITSETAEIIRNLPLSYSYLFLKSLFAVSFEAFFFTLDPAIVWVISYDLMSASASLR